MRRPAKVFPARRFWSAIWCPLPRLGPGRDYAEGSTAPRLDRCRGLPVAEVGVPLLAAAFWQQIEQVPQRGHRVTVARILARFAGRVEQLRAPEVTYGLAVAPEHVHHRRLGSVGVLAVVVAVEGAARRRQQPQMPPAAAL